MLDSYSVCAVVCYMVDFSKYVAPISKPGPSVQVVRAVYPSQMAPKPIEHHKRCFSCQKEIESKDDYFSIFRKRTKGANLFFHVACFENEAGTAYSKALKAESKLCRLCSSEFDATVRGVICTNCQEMCPLCDKCAARNMRSRMQVKVNKAKNNLFLGCSSYPKCKNTRNIG